MDSKFEKYYIYIHIRFFKTRGVDMDATFFETRGVDMDTEFSENRGVDMDMDTAWNRCPPNSGSVYLCKHMTKWDTFGGPPIKHS